MKEMKAVREPAESSFTCVPGRMFGLHAVMGTNCTALRHGVSDDESLGSVGAECRNPDMSWTLCLVHAELASFTPMLLVLAHRGIDGIHR